MRSHPHHPLRTAMAGAVVAVLLAVPGCRKTPDLTPEDALTIGVAGGDKAIPTVKTDSLSVSGNTVYAELVHHGSDWVRQGGICYGWTATPVVSDSTIIPWTGGDTLHIGVFKVPLVDNNVRLVSRGMYVRAYAKNAAGIGYGERVFRIPGITVSIISVEDVDQTTATVHAQVVGTDAGVRGVCYYDANMDSLGRFDYPVSGLGEFSVDLSDLERATPYYVKAYALFDRETVYSDPFQFTTRRCPRTMRDTDTPNNVYSVVEIGNDCWMAENLRATQDSSGAQVDFRDYHNAWNGDTAGALCAPDYDTENVQTHGYLYNRFAVNRGLCPAGWRLPENGEWSSISSNEQQDLFPRLAGYRNTATPDSTRQSPMYQYHECDSVGWWWTSTTPGSAYQFNGSTLTPVQNIPPGYGLSVRCIQAQ